MSLLLFCTPVGIGSNHGGNDDTGNNQSARPQDEARRKNGRGKCTSRNNRTSSSSFEFRWIERRERYLHPTSFVDARILR